MVDCAERCSDGPQVCRIIGKTGPPGNGAARLAVPKAFASRRSDTEVTRGVFGVHAACLFATQL